MNSARVGGGICLVSNGNAVCGHTRVCFERKDVSDSVILILLLSKTSIGSRFTGVRYEYNILEAKVGHLPPEV